MFPLSGTTWSVEKQMFVKWCTFSGKEIENLYVQNL